jgi:hypothetical protein
MNGPDYYLGSIITLTVGIIVLAVGFEILRLLWERRK